MRNFSAECQSWEISPILNIYQIIVMFVIIFGNILLLMYILGSNRRRLKSNLLILSLTIADLCAGSIPSTFGVIVSYFSVSQIFCDLYLFFALLFARIASNMIMVISFDRFFRLKYSMEYRTRWSSSTPKIISIFTVWIAGIILSLIHVIDSIYNAGNYIKGCFIRESYSHWEQNELIITIVTPNVIAVILYFKVLLFVRDENSTKVIKRSLDPKHNPGSFLRKHQGEYVNFLKFPFFC